MKTYLIVRQRIAVFLAATMFLSLAVSSLSVSAQEEMPPTATVTPTGTLAP
jgi:hypothetical protein